MFIGSVKFCSTKFPFLYSGKLRKLEIKPRNKIIDEVRISAGI